MAAEDRVDLTPLVNEEIEKLQSQPFDAQIEALHVLERKTRVGKDDPANCIVCKRIANLCIENQKWQDLGVNVSTLAKRRGYSRRSISEIVKLSMDALDKISTEEERIALRGELQGRFKPCRNCQCGYKKNEGSQGKSHGVASSFSLDRITKKVPAYERPHQLQACTVQGNRHPFFPQRRGGRLCRPENRVARQARDKRQPKFSQVPKPPSF